MSDLSNYDYMREMSQASQSLFDFSTDLRNQAHETLRASDFSRDRAAQIAIRAQELQRPTVARKEDTDQERE
jgi:hypothetical protein